MPPGINEQNSLTVKVNLKHNNKNKLYILQLVTFWILAFANKISMVWVNIIIRFVNGNFHGYAKARVRVATTKHTLSFPTATPHHIEKSQTFGVNYGYPSYSHPHDPSSRYELCCADGF
jgi:hypothetical protein